MNNVDKEYFRLLDLILTKGREKSSRAGDTIGVFGAQAKFDLSEGFPLLTTKKMFTRGIIHELLWFISGNTNIKYLVDNDVHIWDADAYRAYLSSPQQKIVEEGFARWQGNHLIPLTKDEFIEKIQVDDNFAQIWGDLGKGSYGSLWRAFPYFYERQVPDPNGGDREYFHPMEGTVDQLSKVIDTLKTNPDSRRIIISAWHPYLADTAILPPCHCFVQFNTEELTFAERWNIGHLYRPLFMRGHDHETMDKMGIPRRRLNCLLYQRSCDFFLGIPMNIASYGLLTTMIAQVANMVPGIFIHTYGDAHLYQEHVELAKLQLSREPYPLPELWLNPKVKSIFDYKFEDIRIEGYQSYPAIKANVLVG